MELAELYSRVGRQVEAESLYRRTLAGLEKAYVRNQKVVADALDKVAVFYTSQGKKEVAEPLYQRAIGIWENELVKVEENRGAGHPDTVEPLLKLAKIYQARAQDDKAEPLYGRALEIRLAEVKWESLNTIDLRAVPPLTELAKIYKSQGKHDEAERLYDTLLKLLEWNVRATQNIYGREHPSEVVRALKRNASLLREVGRTKDAEAMEAQVTSVSSKR